MNKDLFYKQTDLLLSVIPHISKDTDFALHGGTAINFFVRDLPRLSVDIDLTYLKIGPRDEALQSIGRQLKIVSRNIVKSMPSVAVEEKVEPPHETVTKLFVKAAGSVVKIEPNPVIRGALSGFQELDICARAESVFNKFLTVKTLAFSDLYGSKLCAALDRQHPRDIFDVMLLLNHEGITQQIRKSFLVYLISHNRPIAELLSPNFKDMRPVFEKEFAGMASIDVTYDELVEVRKTMVEEINGQITDAERAFLVSFKENKPQWDLLGIDSARDMPAVVWKSANLARMHADKHRQSLDQLKRALGL